MKNYIDLHTHILPDIDDGPRTLNESVMLAEAFVAAGYETVVATPHTLNGRPTPAQIMARLDELQNELDRKKIPLKLLPGSEQHIETNIPNLLAKEKIVTLNQTHYLLLELPMQGRLPLYTEQLLFALVARGYRPVIPHPERVEELQKNPQLLHRLYKAGAIFQVTWGALTGRIGPAAQKLAHDMLAADLVHLFSTDAHNFTQRLLAIDEAAARLEELQGPGAAELYLTTRPRQLLANKTLDLPKPRSLPTRSNKLFSIFKRRQSN
jgi:protein-tyrosine phosphatase